MRSNATLESVQIFLDEMNKYREGISDEDLEFTRNALLKSGAREFETPGALQYMLENISMYGLPADYVTRQQEVTRNMTPEQHRELAQRYVDPGQMYFVVVGDAATQMEPLKTLGLGEPMLVSR